LIIDEKRGLLFFTDPRYGDQTGVEQEHVSSTTVRCVRGPGALTPCSPQKCVFRVNLTDKAMECIVANLTRPNGLVSAHRERARDPGTSCTV
jgi:hypothetical protein